MVISHKEPYELNIKTRVKFSFKKGKNLSIFKRENEVEKVEWLPDANIFADRLTLRDYNHHWRAEIQAMTENKFHLKVDSLKKENYILYSGIVFKIRPYSFLISIFH